MNNLRSLASMAFSTWLLMLASALFSNTASAASLNVTPVRAEISADTRIAVFEVRNLGEITTPIQVQAFSWSQVDGKDVRTPASDLLVVPPVTEIAPKGTQLVRIALRDNERSRERPYRVVIRELPAQGDDNGGFRLNTLLAFDIPLFFLPADGAWSLDWKAHPDGIEVRNNGSMHARLAGFRVTDRGGKVLAESEQVKNVLPGASYVFAVPLQNAAAASRLTFVVDGKEYSVSLQSR